MTPKQKTRSVRLTPSHLLSLLFLAFLLYVGLAPLSALVESTKAAYRDRVSPEAYIDTVDGQYLSMLSTGRDAPPLQNKGTYINFNGLMAKLLGQPEMNDRVTLKNGHLASLVTKVSTNEKIRSTADNIIRFYEAQKDAGGDFLFVMVSSQVSKYEDLLPPGYTDTTNDTADRLLACLADAGVPCLDLREEMHRAELSVTDAYFVTDHHWRPRTGFWAYTRILEKLQQMDVIAPVEEYYTDPDNFRFVSYPDTFLGSSGKRTGIYYAGVDDSCFIEPVFDTDITLMIPQWDKTLRGRYEEVCYNTDAVHNFEDPDYFCENMYGLYGWGDTKLSRWRNENAPEDRKLLLIGESFGNIPFSLMSLYFTSCDEMDMRYFDGDFPGYYAEHAPDTVILEVNVDQAIAENTTYAYFPGKINEK